MAARPYRERAAIEPDPPPSPEAALVRLGGLRSLHVPPPLHRALVGPVLIAGLIAGIGVVAGVPVAIAVPVAAATLAVLAWQPLRLRGFSVWLHAHGLVLSRSGARSVVAFEDVNEVWCEIDRLESQAGAYLRALRLLDFAGEVHRLPLAVNDAAALANGVLQACAGPLLAEARQALGEGETLTFGPIQLDRAGLTVRGARAEWREIRLAAVQRGRVFLYRRFPLLSWRTVRLDSIPNPAVFVGLVLACVAKARVDDQLLVPLGSTANTPALTAEQRTELGLRHMLVGGLFFLGGLGVSWATYAADSRSYVLAYGPILFGAVRFYQGFSVYVSGRRR